MKNQLVFIANVDSIKTEDNGQAKIATLIPSDSTHFEEGIFLRLQSWQEDKDHIDFDRLIKPGKQYIVHIEQVED
jgi:hypothetical protein